MIEAGISANSDRNFVIQQGLEATGATSCTPMTSALLFQPRIVGVVLVAGAIARSPQVFTVLAALLAWSALFPRLSPFDFVYNLTFGRRPGAPRLGPAPAPRRFSQGMAATFAAAIAASMGAGHWVTAWTLVAFFSLAVGALIFGRLCFGSFLYHLMRGQVGFATRTLPWGRGV